MSIELGRIGIWRHPSGLGPEMVAEVEALVVHGDAEALGRGVTAHLDAGADHVAVQVLDPEPLPALRALAGSLGLAAAGDVTYDV